jgi:uncharacterized membrane protein YfcA
VVLRTLWPAVLGLGGWCLASLIVLTVLPRVPVDDELLTSLSVGLPIALGVYLAWRSSAARTIGLAASVAGALVGAWLGYTVTTGFLALVTTIAGAAVGANLVLLVLDITWGTGRSADRPGGAALPCPASH